ncbi:MAG: hypothetical protein ACHRXM_04160 [Isosphaerales bacterium]
MDQRLLLNGGGKLGLVPEHSVTHVEPLAARASLHAKAGHPQKRLRPAAEINAQYTAFLNAFNQQLNSYVASLNQSSTGTVTVSATVTAAYAAGSPTIEVDDAAVFGPQGTFSPTVPATASIGNAPSIGTFTLTGSLGNTLTINVADSSFIPMSVGTVLTATVPASAANSAMLIFPSYITNSTSQMAISLVKYFNSLPLVLPKENAPPHTPVQRGAIQKYIFQSIASSQSSSLQQLLLAIPLPTTPGGDLNIYKAAVNSAVAESHLQVISGIQQIYAGTLLISATQPANRLGVSFTATGTASYSISSTTTS